ncbi:reverse transcriptase [Vairimorpha necatrix]|uniref:Reverse transcriptase n=1 Tax=Vairimorpha necatrix TaxID=6039 RepID=A0AAX4JFX2_9MICR
MSQKLFYVANLLSSRETKKIEWNEKHKIEIKKILKAIEENLVLSPPDFTQKFVLQCDASEEGMGAVETDSKNCVFANKEISNRIERWEVLFNEYFLEIVSIQGEKNNVADLLS